MTDSRPPEVIEACAQARRDIAETIGIADPSIMTNIIHSLVTAHGDLTRLPREKLARLACSAYRALYDRPQGRLAMCANGVDLGHSCRLCGKPLLSCWDDGPSISWHADEADGRECVAAILVAAKAV